MKFLSQLLEARYAQPKKSVLVLDTEFHPHHGASATYTFLKINSAIENGVYDSDSYLLFVAKTDKEAMKRARQHLQGTELGNVEWFQGGEAHTRMLQRDLPDIEQRIMYTAYFDYTPFGT